MIVGQNAMGMLRPDPDILKLHGRNIIAQADIYVVVTLMRHSSCGEIQI